MRGVESAKAKIILYKCALYGVVLYLVGILQVTFFAKINLIGASPDLLLAAASTIALYEDGKTASICGIISGFFYCALGGTSLPLYILFSFICAYALHIATESGLPRKHSSFLAVTLLSFGAKALFNVAELSLTAQSFNVFSAFWNTVLPEFVSSILFSPIPYIIFFGLTRIFNKKH